MVWMHINRYNYQGFGDTNGSPNPGQKSAHNINSQEENICLLANFSY